MRRAALERVLAATAARTPIALVTRLADGAQATVTGAAVDGELVLDAAALGEVHTQLGGDRSTLLGDGALFVRSYVPVPRLFVVGAVHVAQLLVPMARMAGYAVTVIDPRRAFATAARFPEAELCHDWPDKALEARGVDARSALVTLAHDPKIDDPALRVALAGDPFYVGALGSRRTHAKRVERLTAEGLGDRVGMIHAPIGLDLGGRAAAEIAVAILAQVIQARYRGSAA
jgi:xanthine dehydrogenase accessory factor